MADWRCVSEIQIIYYFHGPNRVNAIASSYMSSYGKKMKSVKDSTSPHTLQVDCYLQPFINFLGRGRGSSPCPELCSSCTECTSRRLWLEHIHDKTQRGNHHITKIAGILVVLLSEPINRFDLHQGNNHHYRKTASQTIPFTYLFSTQVHL